MNVFKRKPVKKTPSEQYIYDRRNKLMAGARRGNATAIRNLKREYQMHIYTPAEVEAYEQDA